MMGDKLCFYCDGNVAKLKVECVCVCADWILLVNQSYATATLVSELDVMSFGHGHSYIEVCVKYPSILQL